VGFRLAPRATQLTLQYDPLEEAGVKVDLDSVVIYLLTAHGPARGRHEGSVASEDGRGQGKDQEEG